jgi:hypothetical protein
MYNISSFMYFSLYNKIIMMLLEVMITQCADRVVEVRHSKVIELEMARKLHSDLKC